MRGSAHVELERLRDGGGKFDPYFHSLLRTLSRYIAALTSMHVKRPSRSATRGKTSCKPVRFRAAIDVERILESLLCRRVVLQFSSTLAGASRLQELVWLARLDPRCSTPSIMTAEIYPRRAAAADRRAPQCASPTEKMNQELQVSYGDVLKSLAVKAGVGLTVAAITNPYVGAIVAMAPELGNAMRTVLGDFVQRQESQRRSSRVLLATEKAMERIGRRLRAGEHVRSDGFFRIGVNRSKAEEVYEAVVEACISQYEEKKIPHVANIFSYAVFEPVSTGTLNALIRQASEKTWRHFCLLSLLHRADTVSLVSDFFAIPTENLEPIPDAPHLRADLERLHGRATSLIDERGGRLTLTSDGAFFATAARLDEIDDEDFATIKATMRKALSPKTANDA